MLKLSLKTLFSLLTVLVGLISTHAYVVSEGCDFSDQINDNALWYDIKNPQFWKYYNGTWYSSVALSNEWAWMTCTPTINLPEGQITTQVCQEFVSSFMDWVQLNKTEPEYCNYNCADMHIGQFTYSVQPSHGKALSIELSGSTIYSVYSDMLVHPCSLSFNSDTFYFDLCSYPIGIY
ncbi:hypothetical protein K7432_014926 [Basidiobolus ranarum]|uniref:Uncharacterized protein n=1 Tax=Basidiobolus ranarum TaxID=34480 RepID=A0ABR2VNT1_9FUNG